MQSFAIVTTVLKVIHRYNSRLKNLNERVKVDFNEITILRFAVS